ncbi:MAG: hypothetical protein IAE80_23000 [Anaerolinea sp.]|nr:hypothetical protein [Anaerolinea sp.]
MTTTAEVSLRSGPGTEWRRITVVPAGTALRLDGRAPGGGWVRGITSNGEIGWVVTTSLTITQAQIDGLRQIWVEEPFTLSPPGAANPPAAPTAAPDAPPDATPVPPAANPVNPSPVRGFSYGGHVHGMGPEAVAHMQRAGMTWVKRQLRNGEDPVGAINQAHANGFRILLGMVGERTGVMDDGYIGGYVSWLANAAAAGADAIEVWNEPNIPHEWADGQISPARYTEILRRAYQAIKAANPGTLVISGAPAPTGYFGGCTGDGCDDNQFIAGMARAGAANYLDCVGVHYNEGILSPNATSGDPRGSGGYYTRYFWGMINTYTAVFGRSRPLCFTELGYLTPEGYPPLPGSFGWAANVTVAQQAEWLDQAVSLAANSGRVRLLIIWNIDFTEYGADPQAGFAIIRPGGGCPACDALGS